MPYSKIKLISFDLDNTLYDNWPVIQLAEEKSQQFLQMEFNKQNAIYDHQVFAQYRKELLQTESDLQHHEKAQFDDMSFLRQKVLSKCCESLDNAQNIVDKAFDIFLNYRNKVTIQFEIVSMLQRLTKQYLLVSVTNGNCDARELTISGLFEKSYSPTSGFRAKPHPEMLEQVLKDFSLSPNQVLHVGDQLDSDGGVARQIGCKFFHFEPFIEGNDLIKSCDQLTSVLGYHW